MNRLLALTLAVGLAGAMAAGNAGAAEPTPQTLLTNALLCQENPLEIIRKMAESGSSHYAQGYAAAAFGVDDLKVSVVALQSPLKIAGAETSAVVNSYPAEDDFGAQVYGRFRGDYRQAVSALKLIPTAKKGDLPPLGRFTRATAIDIKGHRTGSCPMTIALTPMEDGTFLLGCGWCKEPTKKEVP